MPFNFSFSTSATFVSTSSVNGETKGWAYKRESYRNNDGSGVRTTRQNLGEDGVTQTVMYDAQGRPLLTDGYHHPQNQYQGNNYSNSNRNGYNYNYNYNGGGSWNYNSNHNGVVNQQQRRDNAPTGVGRIISIEDVTEEENAKAAAAAANAQQWNNDNNYNNQGKN